MPSLLIIGAGQYGRVAEDVAIAMGMFEKIAFLDDVNSCAIGKISECHKLISQYDSAYVAIGNPDVRADMIELLESAGYNLVNLIHPLAWISPSAQLDCGVIAEAYAVINTSVCVGRGCIISAGAVVNHNAVLGDTVHVDCNATVAARAIVPRGIKILSNTVYTNNQNSEAKHV